MPQHVHIAIIGAGFSGLGAAIRLREAGVDDFLVLERADDVGGTWQANTYPGCACDVPSHLYSFSFALNPDWTRSFSPQPEIWDYLRRVAHERGVIDRVRLGVALEEAAWDDDARLWRLETSAGELTADVVVSAVGALAEPALPDIPGIESFEGTVFHSARWNHDHDLSGERVAVIGTGASAIQFVPQIQPRVAELHVFQRTPAWVAPRMDRPTTAVERFVYRTFPPLQRVARAAIYWSREALVIGMAHERRLMRIVRQAAIAHLRRQVRDPELRRRLTPDYEIGCKRILISNDFYPALTRDNVNLVTDGIAEVRRGSIVTDDGVEREVDTLICGTGFHVTDSPSAERVRGRDGESLADVWDGSPQTYRGTTIAGFPNFFMLAGPNTGIGHTSLVYMIEAQLEYLMAALRVMEEQDVAVIEPRADAQEAFNAGVQKAMKDTVWTAGGCASWYIDAKGRNTTLWPGFTFNFRRLVREFEPAHHELTPREVPAGEPLPAAA